MVPHRFSSSLSVENLVLPFVTVKAGLLSSPMEKQPRFYASGVQLAGRYRLAKKNGTAQGVCNKQAPLLLR